MKMKSNGGKFKMNSIHRLETNHIAVGERKCDWALSVKDSRVLVGNEGILSESWEITFKDEQFLQKYGTFPE
jgi:hypothetical protein